MGVCDFVEIRDVWFYVNMGCLILGEYRMFDFVWIFDYEVYSFVRSLILVY